MSALLRLLIRAVLVAGCLGSAAGTGQIAHESRFIGTRHGVVRIDLYEPRAAHLGAVILLHGSGGLASRQFPYRAEARNLAGAGFVVIVPHYLNSTNEPPAHDANQMSWWADVVEDVANYAVKSCRMDERQIALLGYSLGASLALAVASRGGTLGAVVSWSGSLPDESYLQLRTLPHTLILHGVKDKVIPVGDAQQLERLCHIKGLACETRYCPNEGHAFQAKGIKDAEMRIREFLLRNLSARGVGATLR